DYRVVAPSRFPSVERDLAVIVPLETPAYAVEATTRRHGGPLLRDVPLFDTSRGQPLAETDKSLAYRLTLRDDDRTLTDAERDAAVAGVVAGLSREHRARVL